jgi:ATP-dependent DNA ligase
MKPIAPMLAVPMSKADIRDWNDYVAEEKYDGWRFVVTIPRADAIVAHTRERKHAGGGPKDQNDASDLLTPDVRRDLECLRPRTGFMTLDGEYLAIHADGHVGTSTDVPRKELAKRYVVFDVLMTAQGSCMMLAYAERRRILEQAFALAGTFPHPTAVVMSEVRPCVDADTVANYTHEVWDRGGEGLILKLKTRATKRANVAPPSSR